MVEMAVRMLSKNELTYHRFIHSLDYIYHPPPPLWRVHEIVKDDFMLER